MCSRAPDGLSQPGVPLTLTPCTHCGISDRQAACAQRHDSGLHTRLPATCALKEQPVQSLRGSIHVLGGAACGTATCVTTLHAGVGAALLFRACISEGSNTERVPTCSVHVRICERHGHLRICILH